MTALVAGGTGLVGGLLLKQLAASGRYTRIVALTRAGRSAAAPQFPAGVETIAVDFENLPAQLAPFPVDDVFSCLGTTIAKAGSKDAFRRIDLGYPAALGQWAIAAGARQFLLVSSVAAEAGSPNFYLRVKAELEDRLASLGFASLHIFRPSFLLGERAESRLGERVGIAIASLFNWALAGPLRKYRGVDAADVARAMSQCAAAWQPGRHVYHFDEIRQLAVSSIRPA